MPASEALKITLVFTRCAQSAVSIDIRFQTMTLPVTSQRDVSPVSADLCSNLFSVFFPLVSTLVSVLVSVSSFCRFLHPLLRPSALQPAPSLRFRLCLRRSAAKTNAAGPGQRREAPPTAPPPTSSAVPPYATCAVGCRPSLLG